MLLLLLLTALLSCIANFYTAWWSMLADRTVAGKNWHDAVVCLTLCQSVRPSVRPSVCLSVCLSTSVSLSVCDEVYCGAYGGCTGFKVVPSWGNFLFTSSDTFTARCIYRSATTHSEKRNRRNFYVWNIHGQLSHMTVGIPDAAFSAVRFCSYTVRLTLGAQYDRPF